MAVSSNRCRHPAAALLAGMLLAIAVCGTVMPAAAAEPVLVVRLRSAVFDTLVYGIGREIRQDFRVEEMIVDSQTSVAMLRKQIERVRPRLVILMDNLPLALFKACQKSLPDSVPVVPSITLMAVDIDRALSGLRNATGIRYEIPVVTSAVNLRYILGRPVRRVGIIHREFMAGIVRYNQTFCTKEQIELLSAALPNDMLDYAFRLRKSLKQLLGENQVDALWVVNDRLLLAPQLIDRVWSPMAKKYGVPVIVGVEALVEPELDFGTYAVLPDHAALGSQVAELIYSIMDHTWNAADLPVQPPLAQYDIVNMRQINKRLKLSNIPVKEIDRILR